jgi:hypothetical protein
LISQWQLEKRVAFTRLLDRLDWLLELRENPARRKKIKGFDELELEEAIEQTADAILRKSEEEHLTLAQAIATTQAIFNFFDEYGFEPRTDPPEPPDSESSWKVCPECGNPAYFRITKANYRCTKGHITDRNEMPGDELFTG